MKLLQLNIWTGRLLYPIQELIEREKPDILCLQEVLSSGKAMLASNAGMFSSFELIHRQTGYEHSFFSPTFAFEVAGFKIELGNAIISRFPLNSQETTFVSGEYEPSMDISQREPNIRNLQTATIEADGKKFIAANHHGYWDADPLGNEQSVAAMQKAAGKLRQFEQPIILAGDLNVTAASPVMRAFDGFLEDLTATHGIETTLSPFNRAKNVPCDHILVGPDITVNNFRVIDHLVSDHKALVLDFTL